MAEPVYPTDHFNPIYLGIHILTAKKSAIVYPVPQPELAAALIEVQTVADKVARLNTAVGELPAKTAQAEADLADISHRLAQAETDLALADGDTSTIRATINSLSAELAEKREAFTRLNGQLPHFNQRGEDTNTELEAAKQKLRTEQSILVGEVRDIVADRIVEKTAELADLRALWLACGQAADGFPHDWLTMAHVSDPRESMQIVVPGRTYDAAPNLLAMPSPGAAVLLQEISAVLEPLKRARSLLRTREYAPRKPATSTVVLRSSSEGPGGRPDTRPGREFA